MAQEDGVRVGDGPISFSYVYRDLMWDQGVGIHAWAEVDGKEVEVLRFDCFDQEPHYHYGPENRDERLVLDKTTEGDSLEWALAQLRERLPDMVRRAGYDQLAEEIEAADVTPTLDELSASTRKLAREGRSTVVHNRGDVIVEAGPVRFGLEFREFASDRGLAIHVLGDVGDEEVELLTFDCFENAPHYHYGPRAKNQRLYLDTTAVPDPLRWALDLFKGGKLASMLERAGYRDHAAGLNPSVLAEGVAEVESTALEIQKANAR